MGEPETMITSVKEFIRLRESGDPHEYSRAASEEAPKSVWREIMDIRHDMRLWVAQNKTVPLDILEELAGDPDPKVRDMVARKRKISEAIALKLAKDSEASIRAALARNPKLPAPALAVLKLDASPLVQEALRSREERG
jgi:hypothetical protein